MWLEKLFLLLCHLYDDTAIGIAEKVDKNNVFFCSGCSSTVVFNQCAAAQ